jgi:hypothetical protein
MPHALTFQPTSNSVNFCLKGEGKPWHNIPHRNPSLHSGIRDRPSQSAESKLSHSGLVG